MGNKEAPATSRPARKAGYVQPRIPRGLRDILPTEASERRALAARCGNVFEAWGYGEIATPAFEYFDLLATETGEEISREMFRFVDSDGRLVALRPEMTTPIARAVAQRLAGEPAPQRLFYVQNVFREEPAQRGQQREFWQAGIELLGARGPAADMEVVAVTAEALIAAGLGEFQVGIGQVGVFRAVLDRAGIDQEARGRAEGLATSRNLVGLGQLLSNVSPKAASAVISLVETRGGREAIETAAGIVDDDGPGREALEELAETYRLIVEYGLGDKVMLDFGIIRNFDYYTGFVLEAYAPGIGFPIGAGGRYDALLAEFGAPMPAAGFATGLERLHIAIAEQGELITGSRDRVVVAWESDPADALLVARELRANGIAAIVELEPASAEGLAVRTRETGAVSGVLVASGGEALLVVDPFGETKPVAGVDALVRELTSP